MAICLILFLFSYHTNGLSAKQETMSIIEPFVYHCRCLCSTTSSLHVIWTPFMHESVKSYAITHQSSATGLTCIFIGWRRTIGKASCQMMFLSMPPTSSSGTAWVTATCAASFRDLHWLTCQSCKTLTSCCDWTRTRSCLGPCGGTLCEL